MVTLAARNCYSHRNPARLFWLAMPLVPAGRRSHGREKYGGSALRSQLPRRPERQRLLIPLRTAAKIAGSRTATGRASTRSVPASRAPRSRSRRADRRSSAPSITTTRTTSSSLHLACRVCDQSRTQHQRGWRGSAVRLSAGSVMADTCDPPCKIVWRNSVYVRHDARERRGGGSRRGRSQGTTSQRAVARLVPHANGETDLVRRRSLSMARRRIARFGLGVSAAAVVLALSASVALAGR